MNNENIMRTPRVLKETSHGMDICSLEDELFLNRRIFFTCGVNTDSSNELIKQLLYLDRDAPGEEITLYINSPGGDVLSGFAAYDCIRLLKSPVRTVCTGLAASMGAILFLAGEKREMLPHTQIMIHDPSYYGNGPSSEKPLEMQKRLESIMKTRERLCQVIAQRTGKDLKEIYEKTREDSFFTVQEALDFGIATGVVRSMD